MTTLVGILRSQLAMEKNLAKKSQLLTPERAALLLTRQEAYKNGEKCYSPDEVWQHLEEEWHVKL
ncbi:MAG: hypothetical protein Q4G02_03565 [bacterium]|nr:hypothetical protein [bacterium]